MKLKAIEKVPLRPDINQIYLHLIIILLNLALFKQQ
jgi:hypothetical protein